MKLSKMFTKIALITISIICFFKVSYASNIYAVIENGQILFKNKPVFHRNSTNNKYPVSYIKKLLRKASLKYDVNEKFVMAIARAESDFNDNALSDKGAIGVMQIIPSTASFLNINPKNLEQNINGGVRYLKFLLNKYSGNYVLTAAAYNSGYHRVDEYNGIPPIPETINYVKTVMNYFHKTGSASEKVMNMKRHSIIVDKNGVYTNIIISAIIPRHS